MDKDELMDLIEDKEDDIKKLSNEIADLIHELANKQEKLYNEKTQLEIYQGQLIKLNKNDITTKMYAVVNADGSLFEFLNKGNYMIYAQSPLAKNELMEFKEAFAGCEDLKVAEIDVMINGM